MKISKKDLKNSDIATMSNEMLKSLKSEIAKFGFKNEEYYEFLRSVMAMKKNEDTVIQYPNAQMEIYREKFIKKHEHSLGDSFILEKFKIETSDDDGRRYETGWFAPRSFWDNLLKSKIH